MNRLIKLSEQHYIIVDDSIDFTEIDYYYDTKQNSIRHGSNNHVTGGYKQKITHSTQPLSEECKYCTGACEKCVDSIKSLSLAEVEEVINGYNVDKISKKEYPDDLKNVLSLSPTRDIWIKGFKAHQELVKDKLFTLDDIRNAIEMARDIKDNSAQDTFTVEEITGLTEVCTYNWENKYSHEQIIQNFLPKNSWDIEINSNNKIILI